MKADEILRSLNMRPLGGVVLVERASHDDPQWCRAIALAEMLPGWPLDGQSSCLEMRRPTVRSLDGQDVQSPQYVFHLRMFPGVSVRGCVPLEDVHQLRELFSLAGLVDGSERSQMLKDALLAKTDVAVEATRFLLSQYFEALDTLDTDSRSDTNTVLDRLVEFAADPKRKRLAEAV